MSKTIFNEHQRRALEANPNKVKVVKENLQGKGPSQIFVENGFVLVIIESDKPKEPLKR